MNEFLKTRQEIFDSTKWLMENDYVHHPISCKDWELAKVIQSIGNGDLIDLGANGSFVLHNAIIKGITGRKVGIDLAEVTGINKAEGAEYFKGDLMQTGLPEKSFDTIVSLSVIEHEVNFEMFAKECSRLLRKGGKLIVSFDYWPIPLDTSAMKLYSLDWNILSDFEVIKLINNLEQEGMKGTSPIDNNIKDAVITPQYCSPAQVSYTFGILEFIKK